VSKRNFFREFFSKQKLPVYTGARRQRSAFAAAGLVVNMWRQSVTTKPWRTFVLPLSRQVAAPQLNFFAPPPPFSTCHLNLFPNLAFFSELRVFLELRQLRFRRNWAPQLEQQKKMKKFSEFGRDPVARGSSGLKPLRRRAPLDSIVHYFWGKEFVQVTFSGKYLFCLSRLLIS